MSHTNFDIQVSFLQGTKFQLNRVKKYVFSTGAAASYYITLDAMEPAADSSSSLQTFQTEVTEDSFGKFILTCNIARIRGKKLILFLLIILPLFQNIRTNISWDMVTNDKMHLTLHGNLQNML